MLNLNWSLQQFENPINKHPTNSAGAEREPPAAFWFAGDPKIRLSDFSRRCHIGVIGTRRPTSYGLRFLNEWLDLQQREGFAGVIVSGGALGVDGAAHQGALARGLKTQAVLVGPKVQPNPRSHERLFSRMAETPGCGLWIPSDLEPGPSETPKSYWWLKRNQWLSSLCDVLIVVEAGLYSGTWYTVKIAQKFGIPTYALPGRFDSAVSEGTNAMITRGYATGIQSTKELQKTLVVDLERSTYTKESGQVEWGTSPADTMARGPEIDLKLLEDLRVWLRQPGGVGLNDLAFRALEAGYQMKQLHQVLTQMGDRGELNQMGDRFEGRR